MRRCITCGEDKSLEDFHKTSASRSGTHRSECKSCRAARGAQRWVTRRSDPNLKARDSGRQAAKERQRKYGITPCDFTRRLIANNANCEICGLRETLVVDHDHSCCPALPTCGECVRGLICHPCNKGLGSFADDVQRVQAASAYLERNTNVSQA